MNIRHRGIVAEALPELFGNVRDHRIGELQHLANHQILNRETVVAQGFVTTQLALGCFHIPITEIAPEKGVDLVRQWSNFVVGKALLDLSSHFDQARQDPMIVIVAQTGVDPTQDCG